MLGLGDAIAASIPHEKDATFGKQLEYLQMQLGSEPIADDHSSDGEEEEEDSECFLEEEELSHLLIKDLPEKKQDILTTQFQASPETQERLFSVFQAYVRRTNTRQRSRGLTSAVSRYGQSAESGPLGLEMPPHRTPLRSPSTSGSQRPLPSLQQKRPEREPSPSSAFSFWLNVKRAHSARQEWLQTMREAGFLLEILENRFMYSGAYFKAYSLRWLQRCN